MSNDGLYIQYGCGLCAPSGWLNFDASPRLRVERSILLRPIVRRTVGFLFPANVTVGDIVSGLPVPDESAVGIYCSHVLEHLPRDDLPRALANTFRILKSGGRFRLVVPDLHWRAARYLAAAERDDPSAADQLLSTSLLGKRRKPRDLVGLIKDHYGNSAHLWMYDFSALKALLEQVGFIAVRRCELGDADDPMFGLVEHRGRFFEGGERELAMEAGRA